MIPQLLRNIPYNACAFDTETWCALPNQVPPLVCASWADHTGQGILTKMQARIFFVDLLKSNRVIIGAHFAFDMGVMAHDAAQRGIDILPLIFAKYERGEVFDVIIAERLNAIATGELGRKGNRAAKCGLDYVVEVTTGRKDAKINDFWRKRYAILDTLPMSEWPAEAIQYPIDDAFNTRDACLVQVENYRNTHAMDEMAYAAWALHLGAIWGFHVDQDMVDLLISETRGIIAAGLPRFRALGLVREDGVKDSATKSRMTAIAYGGVEETCACVATRPEGFAVGKAPNDSGKPINCKECKGTGIDLDAIEAIPRTEAGGVCCERDVLIDSGDEDLIRFGEWGEQDKVISTYGPALKKGVELWPNVPLVNERVSYSGIVQTMPRKGGVRGCIITHPGYHLSSVDLSGNEMGTWAQVCLNLLGFSTLADAINEGKDTHSMLGAIALDIPYDEFILKKETDYADVRQACKPINFTCSGGGGVVTITLQKRKDPGMTTVAPDGTIYKGTRFCILMGRAERCGETKTTNWRNRGRIHAPVCVACCEATNFLREAWFKQWPEAKEYFGFISKICDEQGWIKHFGSDIIRGGVEYTQAANSYYSALAAHGTKNGYKRVVKESYTDRLSPLWDSRPIGFIHDEAITAHPIYRSSAAATRVSTLLVEEMRKVTPAVKVVAEPALMLRLHKGAKAVYNEQGILIPWEPSE